MDLYSISIYVAGQQLSVAGDTPPDTRTGGGEYCMSIVQIIR